ADQSVVRGVFPAEERYTAYFFQMAPGVDVSAFRTDLERTFFVYGLQTTDIREQIVQPFDASHEVLTLLQAYLAIGLLVGSAGLGFGVGVALGMALAYKIYNGYFAAIVVFSVPWPNRALIVGVASAAAVASAAQPAIRASRIPPAEALRYIE